MVFSVIYQADIPPDECVDTFRPGPARLWSLTEQEDHAESPWPEGSAPESCKHRKWCALLTRDQFNDFLGRVPIYPQDVETGGSLGAPGCGFSLAPAIAFSEVVGYAVLDAYVTPIPIARRPADLSTFDRQFTARDWHRVRRAVLRVYN